APQTERAEFEGMSSAGSGRVVSPSRVVRRLPDAGLSDDPELLHLLAPPRIAGPPCRSAWLMQKGGPVPVHVLGVGPDQLSVLPWLEVELDLPILVNRRRPVFAGGGADTTG